MIFEYHGKLYPEPIRHGNAVKYITPMALEFCTGHGLDIGGTHEWCLPGARPVNIDFNDEHDADHIPLGEYDYIFSSHCLEHIANPISTLAYWYALLSQWKSYANGNGVLYLYLPHPDMEYWLPQNNRKHLHVWKPAEMAKILTDLGYKKVIHSERDMYYSFSVVGVV